MTIHAAWSPGEIQVAVTKDGILTDYSLWRPGSPDGVGDVYRGRVTALVPAMAGAFVALREGTQGGASGVVDGFLPDTEGVHGLTEGTIITVRIIRTALGGKGPRLSARVAAAEEGPVGLVRRGIDPLRELAARYPEAAVFVDDATLAASLRADLRDRITLAHQTLYDDIETEIDSLGVPEVTLQSGVRLSVHPTPALVAIDVDGARALAGKDEAQRRHRAMNAAVIPEIARQIRLRNLSGAILVDLAGLKAKQRASLGPEFAAALADDPLRPRFLGFTGLGLAEIVRPRVRAPLHEMLSGPLASGLAALRVIARSSRAEPGRRLTLCAAPAVVAALQADSVALADLARITGQALNPRADPSLSAAGYRIQAVNG